MHSCAGGLTNTSKRNLGVLLRLPLRVAVHVVQLAVYVVQLAGSPFLPAAVDGENHWAQLRDGG